MVLRGGNKMSFIKPVSALRNYAAVLEDVSTGNPVYLAKNGYGSYAVVTMEDILRGK